MSDDSKRYDIIKGPDRMELMNNFALRNATKFYLGDGAPYGALNVVINGISVESADTHSWLLLGYCIEVRANFTAFYRTHPRYSGEENKQFPGYIDLTPR